MTKNHTTDYFQSLELLQAGLDGETADFYFKDTPSGNKALKWRGEDVVFPLTASEVPSWSMGRLWELLCNAGVYYWEYSTADSPEQVMSSLVEAVERAAKHNLIK